MSLSFRPGDREPFPAHLFDTNNQDHQPGDLYLFLEREGLLDKWAHNVRNNSSTPLFIAEDIIPFLSKDRDVLLKKWKSFEEAQERQRAIRDNELKFTPEELNEHKQHFLTYGKWPKRAASKARKRLYAALELEKQWTVDDSTYELIRKNAKLLGELAKKGQQTQRRKERRQRRKEKKRGQGKEVLIPSVHEDYDRTLKSG